MKKDIFTVWLKEFCSLVFTQAVQAFVLAAIMSVVVATASGNLPANRGAAASATGIIAIIALTAVSKIELLVKKIFGIESQFGDPSMKSGMAGLAGTLIGAKLAGRVLNNVGKVGGGIADMRKASNLKAKARTDMANQLAKLNSANATDPNAVAAAAAVAGGMAGQGNNGLGYGAAGRVAANDIKQGNLTINAQNVDVDGKNNNFEDKKDQILKNYNDAIDKAKEQSKAGAYKTASGLAESVGGMAGGIAGATIGLASGDAILQKAGVGMGIGDFIGESAVKGVRTVHETTINMEKHSRDREDTRKAVSQLTGKDIASYRKAVKELENYTSKLGNVTKDVSKRTDAGNI